MDLKIGDYVLLTSKFYTPSEHHPLVGTFFETYGIVYDIKQGLVGVEWQLKRKPNESIYDEEDLIKVKEKDLCSYYLEPAYSIKSTLKKMFPDFKRKITLAPFDELQGLLEGRIRLYIIAERLRSPYELFKLIVHHSSDRLENGCKSIW